MSFASAPSLPTTADSETSLPVPCVVGTATSRLACGASRLPNPAIASAGPGFDSSIRATFAVSIADPPPSATMKSGVASASAAAHASTDAVSGSPAGVA